MKAFDPIAEVENSAVVLDDGAWPNFHDAIVYSLSFWRGDMRPDDDVWIAPTIDATFELAALAFPYVVDLRFHGCDAIHMAHFDHNNDIYDLSFAFEGRGFYADGITPLQPYVRVVFDLAHGSQSLRFRCFRVEALRRRNVPKPPCR